MHVPATLATLLICIVVMLCVRLRWAGISDLMRRLILSLAVASVIVMTLARAAKISTTSDAANAAVYWTAVLAYVFLLILFTLLRPRWLTSMISVVLFVPLLSASAFLPLTAIYSRLAHRISPLGEGFLSDLVLIDAVTPGESGNDLMIYRPLSWAPFLRRSYISVRYFNTQCDSSSAYAVLQPDHRSVLMVCPTAPGFPPEDGRSIVLPLYSGK